MKIFRGILKAVPEHQPEQESESRENSGQVPELCPGMKVEVLTMENHLIFVGRMEAAGKGVLRLRRETGDPLPQVLYNSKIKLRGFRRDSQPLFLCGTVRENTRDFWQLENVELLQDRENRNFFRQSTDLDACVRPNGHRGAGWETADCKVLDISAGGARILTKNVYQEGDFFQLEAALLPNELPFSITCQVLRVVPKGGSKYEYGCRFEALEEKERQRLLRAIFTIQRKMLHAQRD